MIMLCIPEMARREDNFTWTAGRSERVDDHAFAAEHSAQRFKRAPFESRFHVQGR